MANVHPAPFSTGIDATDVDRLLGKALEILKPLAKQGGEQLADLALELAAGAIEQWTPDIVDHYLEEAKAVAKAKLHLMLFPESK